MGVDVGVRVWVAVGVLVGVEVTVGVAVRVGKGVAVVVGEGPALQEHRKMEGSPIWIPTPVVILRKSSRVIFLSSCVFILPSSKGRFRLGDDDNVARQLQQAHRDASTDKAKNRQKHNST